MCHSSSPLSLVNLSDSGAGTISCNFAFAALAATATIKLVFDFYLKRMHLSAVTET